MAITPSQLRKLNIDLCNKDTLNTGVPPESFFHPTKMTLYGDTMKNFRTFEYMGLIALWRKQQPARYYEVYLFDPQGRYMAIQTDMHRATLGEIIKVKRAVLDARRRLHKSEGRTHEG